MGDHAIHGPARWSRPSTDWNRANLSWKCEQRATITPTVRAYAWISYPTRHKNQLDDLAIYNGPVRWSRPSKNWNQASLSWKCERTPIIIPPMRANAGTCRRCLVWRCHWFIYFFARIYMKVCIFYFYKV
jgi:hypothetical protein